MKSLSSSKILLAVFGVVLILFIAQAHAQFKEVVEVSSRIEVVKTEYKGTEPLITVVAGTDDHIYGQTGSHNLATTNPSDAIDNADSHEYFAENTPARECGTNYLYQLHVNGAIWRYTGTPCSGNSCPGWQRLDNNPKTKAIATGAKQ